MNLQSLKASVLAAYANLSAKQVSAKWVVAAGLAGLLLGLWL